MLSAIGNSLNIRIQKVIEQETRELIDRLLLERISLAGIARAIQIYQQWLQPYVNEKYTGVPRSVDWSRRRSELFICLLFLPI